MLGVQFNSTRKLRVCCKRSQNGRKEKHHGVYLKAVVVVVKESASRLDLKRMLSSEEIAKKLRDYLFQEGFTSVSEFTTHERMAPASQDLAGR